MSNRARLGLIAAALVVAVAAFVVLRPDDTSEKADDPARAGGQAPADTSGGPTATARSAPPPPPTEIELRGHKPVGGLQRIEVRRDRTVRFVVSSDATDEIHLHGYEQERTARAGKPARFRLKADKEGVFEIESHAAEHEGLEPLIARLVVSPS